MYFVHPQFKKFPFNVLFSKNPEKELRYKFSEILPGYNFAFTDSGRSAFHLAIKSLCLENTEILMPAYICDIFKPILEKYNIKPIFLDIDLNTFHINVSEIESKITPQTKSILICHTYGLPFDLNKIIQITKKYNLKIIEDCAHIPPLGLPRAESMGLPRAKSRGDALFFSFAKIFPMINGGVLVSKENINGQIAPYKSNVKNIVKFLRLFPFWAGLSEKFRNKNKMPENKIWPARKSSVFSLKILNEYLGKETSQKIELGNYYCQKLEEKGFKTQNIEGNAFTYVSAIVPENINRDELFLNLRKKGIYCSKIWHNPFSITLPNSLLASKRIINFPMQNWFYQKDIDNIIACI